jgi:lipopolysaccharide/colanic/teichoic acid biosynthesis glycosyltransferase
MNRINTSAIDTPASGGAAAPAAQPASRSVLDNFLFLMLERTLALTIALLTLPLVIAALAFVWYQSKRSPLIAHIRVGLRGEPLKMLKIRTMWPVAPEGPSGNGWQLIEDVDETPPLSKTTTDPRISSHVARLIRRFSIDELPQLVHVIIGQMSLVGPRPLTAGEHEAQYRGYSDCILQIRPGITGLWQVNGRSDLSYAERVQLDCHFVKSRSLWLYLRILIATWWVVLSGKGAA